MADYSSSVGAALEGGAAYSEGQRIVHFPGDERVNSFLYEGLLPSAAGSSRASSSAPSFAPVPLCGPLSGGARGGSAGPPPPAAQLRHPLELQQRQYLRQREQQQLRRAAAVYGLHAPLRLKMERELCAMTQRLPGLPSSLWGLQTLMNLDEEVNVEDYMGRDRPEEEEGDVAGSLGIHERIERHFGLL